MTVCIMSYRYGHLLAQAIESVLSQTCRPNNIIVVDDGIGDCQKIVRIYKGEGIKFIYRIPRLGIVKNFNETLNTVETKRVLFLGAENWLHPEALERINREKADIVSFDGYIVGEGRYRRWTLHAQPHGSAAYNVKLAKQVGGYEDSGREHTEEDSMLFNKMIKAGASFTRIDKPLFYYRTHRRNFNKR